MSKLAHSNTETMFEIELAERERNGEDIELCPECGCQWKQDFFMERTS